MLTEAQIESLSQDPALIRKLTHNFRQGHWCLKSHQFNNWPAPDYEIPDLLQETWMLLFRKRDRYKEPRGKADKTGHLYNWALLHGAAVARRRDIDIFGLRKVRKDGTRPDGRQRMSVDLSNPRFVSYNVLITDDGDDIHEIGDLFSQEDRLPYYKNLDPYEEPQEVTKGWVGIRLT